MTLDLWKVIQFVSIWLLSWTCRPLVLQRCHGNERPRLSFSGKNSLLCVASHHLVARAHSCKGEFRQALTHEKETYKLYKTQLGDDHDKTKESGECLRHLTQQAVTLQRTVRAQCFHFLRATGFVRCYLCESLLRRVGFTRLPSVASIFIFL